MKLITIFVLVFATVVLCQADGDGQYRSDFYGDNKYLNARSSQYRSLSERNGKYGSIYNAYNPFYNQALSRELQSPLQVSFGNSNDQATFPSVTYRTPVVSTYRTPAVSTYRTPAVSTYRTPAVSNYRTPAVSNYRTPAVSNYHTPVVSKYRTPDVSTYRPIVYSTPKPFTVTKPPSAIYQKSVPDAAASIIREDRNYDENNYHFAYETNNGIAAEESGIVDASVNGVGGGTKVRGFYEYIGDDGLKYRVDYVADENGFRASGAHLPKAP